jgi:hypothetical protein
VSEDISNQISIWFSQYQNRLYNITERIKEAQRLGAKAYIKKSYLLEKIGEVIRAELGK